MLRKTCQPKLSKGIQIFFKIISQAYFNNAIETRTFPEKLKYTDVKPVF